jgi:hypothetical protein
MIALLVAILFSPLSFAGRRTHAVGTSGGHYRNTSI